MPLVKCHVAINDEQLASRSVNALILRVDYGFQFISRPEMADKNGLSQDQAQTIAAACKKHDRRVSTSRIGNGHFFRVHR